jgi:hypothetical protein
MNSNTKACPKCGKYVEKNSGCNHIVCLCGQAFCWLCGGATGRRHDWNSIEGHSCSRCVSLALPAFCWLCATTGTASRGTAAAGACLWPSLPLSRHLCVLLAVRHDWNSIEGHSCSRCVSLALSASRVSA